MLVYGTEHVYGFVHRRNVLFSDRKSLMRNVMYSPSVHRDFLDEFYGFLRNKTFTIGIRVIAKVLRPV